MKNVFSKLLELQKTVKALKKDKQSYGYDYLSGNKLFEVVRPKMDELGLLLLPSVVACSSTPMTYNVWDNKAKALVTKTENLVALDIDFTWVDVESGETYTAHWHGTGQNGFDKGYGSALTYAERYYLLKLFHIATDKDDVDAIAAVRDEAVERAAVEVAAKAAENAVPVQVEVAPLFPDVKSLKDNKEYWQWVEATAIGKLSKNGRPAREAFINKYRPTKEQLEEFDLDVADRKSVLAEQNNNNEKK